MTDKSKNNFSVILFPKEMVEMSRICPITNDIVLYLECLECDEKKCQNPTNLDIEKLRKQINEIISSSKETQK